MNEQRSLGGYMSGKGSVEVRTSNDSPKANFVDVCNTKTKSSVTQPWLRNIVKKQLEKISKEKILDASADSKNEPVICPFCSVCFHNEEERTNHMAYCVQIYNKMSRTFSCKFPNCTESFLSVLKRNEHHKTHTERDRFASCQSSLDLGFRRKVKECMFCYMLFPSIKECESHVINEHGAILSDGANDKGFSSGSVQNFKQIDCSANVDKGLDIENRLPEVNSEGVIVIKPTENENEKITAFDIKQALNINEVKLKTEPVGDYMPTVCASTRNQHIKVEPEIMKIKTETITDPNCGVIGEIQMESPGTKATAEDKSMSYPSTFEKYDQYRSNPIVIAPKSDSFRHSLCEKVKGIPEAVEISIKACINLQGIKDNTSGLMEAHATQPNVDVLSMHNSDTQTTIIYPKYTLQRGKQTSHRSKLSNRCFKVKPCSVRLTRLKLNSCLIDQLYFYHQRAKKLDLMTKTPKYRHCTLLYASSSSEDESVELFTSL